MESNGRKCAFLARTVEACAIANAAVVNARAEEWQAGLGRCDVVMARALAPLAVVAEYAAPLLRLGGTLVVWRGRRDPVDEVAGARAAALLGLESLAAGPGAAVCRCHAPASAPDSQGRSHASEVSPPAGHGAQAPTWRSPI